MISIAPVYWRTSMLTVAKKPAVTPSLNNNWCMLPCFREKGEDLSTLEPSPSVRHACSAEALMVQRQAAWTAPTAYIWTFSTGAESKLGVCTCSGAAAGLPVLNTVWLPASAAADQAAD